MTDWLAWHARYDDPTTGLARRLVVVQRAIREVLDRAPTGSLRAIAMCGGEGRDLLPVLATHPRGRDVRATLVELDATLCESARARARDAGLDVEVRCADAGRTDAYAGAVPAGLVLVCGVWGNVEDADIQRTIAALPSLCAPGASVIWTRHVQRPDLLDRIATWFREGGFAAVSLEVPDDRAYGVGVHRLEAEPQAFVPGWSMFRFTTRPMRQ